jgi:hypothetical protein
MLSSYLVQCFDVLCFNDEDKIVVLLCDECYGR